MKPWHVVVITPILSFGSWGYMLSQLPTWNAFQPVHLVITLGCLVAGVGIPFLIVSSTNHKDHW